MVVSSDGAMGCCIWELFDFGDSYIGETSDWSPEDKFPKACSKEGIEALLEQFGSMGAIATWADVIVKKGSKDFSGLKFYKYLKRNGYDVGKSKIVNNPSGSKEVQLYFWYFRTKPTSRVRRSATTIRGKQVEQKAKTSAHKSAG